MSEKTGFLGRFLSKHFSSGSAEQIQPAVTLESDFFRSLGDLQSGIHDLKKSLNIRDFNVIDIESEPKLNFLVLTAKLGKVTDSVNEFVKISERAEQSGLNGAGSSADNMINRVIKDLNGLDERLHQFGSEAHAYVFNAKNAGVHFEDSIKDDINGFKAFAFSEIQKSVDILKGHSGNLHSGVSAHKKDAPEIAGMK